MNNIVYYLMYEGIVEELQVLHILTFPVSVIWNNRLWAYTVYWFVQTEGNIWFMFFSGTFANRLNDDINWCSFILKDWYYLTVFVFGHICVLLWIEKRFWRVLFFFACLEKNQCIKKFYFFLWEVNIWFIFKVRCLAE